MPSQPPLPPLLTPYIYPSPPRSSLTLISSVLGATSNWLVLRFLHTALNSSPSHGGPGDGLLPSERTRTKGAKRVVLLSFLRNYEFWNSEAKRLGVDMGRLDRQGRFRFVDGLSELFNSNSNPGSATSTGGLRGTDPLPSRTTLPSIRSPPGSSTLPARGLPGANTTTTRPISTASSDVSTTAKLHFTGRDTTALDALEKQILSVVTDLQSKRLPNGDENDNSDVILIIDNPDLLLAATGPSYGIGATETGDWIMGLEQSVHSTIITLSADYPLIHNASSSSSTASPLENEHASLVISLAHRARMVMQLRTLHTGAAKDVSGVLRISKGGGYESKGDDDSERDQGEWEEKEVLYFVQRDGGVRVFGRGE